MTTNNPKYYPLAISQDLPATITYTKEELEARLRGWRQFFELTLAQYRTETDSYERDSCLRALRACVREYHAVHAQLNSQPQPQEILPSSFQKRPLEREEPEATSSQANSTHEIPFPRIHAQRDQSVDNEA
jgi:hypothetical protein